MTDPIDPSSAASVWVWGPGARPEEGVSVYAQGLGGAEQATGLNIAEALVAHVSGMLKHLNSRRELAPRQYAAACLARCNRLLAAMILMRSNGFPDVVGLGLRSLLECWNLGMFLLLAPDEAKEVIDSAHMRQLHNLDSSWGDMTSVWDDANPDIDPTNINWKDLSKRVSDLLVEHGHQSFRLYEVIYRAESAMSVHGGLGAFMGHISIGPHSLGITEVRREPEDGSMRIWLAAALHGSLAREVAVTFGLSHHDLDRFGRFLDPV